MYCNIFLEQKNRGERTVNTTHETKQNEKRFSNVKQNSNKLNKPILRKTSTSSSSRNVNPSMRKSRYNSNNHKRSRGSSSFQSRSSNFTSSASSKKFPKNNNHKHKYNSYAICKEEKNDKENLKTKVNFLRL